MAITESDVRLYASERMTDFADGGGAMSPTVIVDGLDNNVFPDVTDIDRLTGRSSVRKVFGAVVSADTGTYLSAHALLDDAADDGAIDALLLAFGDYATERAAVAAAMATMPAPGSMTGYSPGVTVVAVIDATLLFFDEWSFSTSAGSATASIGGMSGRVLYLTAGDTITLVVGGVGYARKIVSVTQAESGNSYTSSLALDAAIPATGTSKVRLLRASNPRCYGVGLSSAGAISGASAITVGRVFARVVPVDLAAPYPTLPNAQWLTDPSFYRYTQGQVQVIQPNDGLLIHSTIAMTPAAVANAQVVTTGRTNLARLRVIGNNGVEHARFTRGVPAPTGVGCTADLTAGTVTFSNVSGMSQPVTVEHRIEEMVLATAVSVGTGVITLNRPLSRAYPAGTKVSSLCMLGDLQGRVTGGFAQTAWTGVFSDTVLGGTPTADFNGAVYPIVTTNAGAIADRWLITFTNTTTFRCTGELTGEISGGSTGAAYAPINPATGAPYFTIPALGWGSGWASGNVYRFNTSGANAPLWLLRTVAPSAPSSASDSVTVEFRGYVNT